MGRKYYLDPVTKEKIYIRNTVSKPPVIDVQVNGDSVLEDRIANINLSDKQDTLISGVNIKTINNESILGSGNIEIQGGGTIDSEMSLTSTNAVQNKVITAALETKNGVISIDSETLVIS